MASELESDLWDIVEWGRKWLIDFNLGKTQLISLTRLMKLVLLMWKWMGLFLRENHLLRCWVAFLFRIVWGSYIISSAKSASKKIGALIRSMKFLSPEIVLFLYKSSIQPCIKYYCPVWDFASSCYLELLNKLQKGMCRTLSPSLTACLEPLTHCQNVASLKVTSATKIFFAIK